MKNKMYIFPHNPKSKSAVALGRSLPNTPTKFRINPPETSKFKGGKGKTVINWGSGKLSPEIMKCRVINNPVAVNNASDKCKFLDIMQKSGVSSLEFTSSKAEVKKWMKAGFTTVARTLTRGSAGRGIVLIRPSADPDRITDAPLYTKYIPKKDEYRVHVVNGRAIDVQRKALKKDVKEENAQWEIRTHGNGFVFVRENVNPPTQVIEFAIEAVLQCGLDFGAVDVIYNHHRDTAYVLEVNTAPGLEGQTLTSYTNALGGL